MSMQVHCAKCPLRKLGLFTDLTEEEERFMLNFKVGELKVEPGGPILSEGAASPYFFTVLSGYGIRSKALDDGRRQVINFILPGDFLGLQTALMGEMGHSVDATTDMMLCVFARERLWELYQSAPSRAFDVTWLAAREERFLGDTLLEVGQKSARERIAAALWRLHNRAGALKLLHRGKAPMPWRQQDFADALGLSLVHTNKMLGTLRSEGLATWRNGHLEVRNLDDLAMAGKLDAEPAGKRPLI